jgi:hypothetical protein
MAILLSSGFNLNGNRFNSSYGNIHVLSLKLDLHSKKLLLIKSYYFLEIILIWGNSILGEDESTVESYKQLFDTGQVPLSPISSYRK